MRIAFISYEYPPDTASGGIATYVRQAAQMMRDRGHEVEVFAASPHRTGTEEEQGLLVHRLAEPDRRLFPDRIGGVFAARHAEARFDVLEGPDYRADASEAVRLVPGIPLVLRLHTPSYVISAINTSILGPVDKARMCVRAVRRGRHPFRHPNDAVERRHAHEADEIAAPSYAIGERLARDWRLDRGRISLVPLPYVPVPEFLQIPAATHTNTVMFLGRLEIRKGVLDLARAIPLILKRNPTTQFRFVGGALDSPRPDQDMRQYLEDLLREHRGSVTFTGQIALDTIPTELANTDICVFPSLWESFGLVCAEAMAAARGIVASDSGGMAELLARGDAGLLIPPRDPQRIASAVTALLADPERRIRLGEAARQRVLTEYGIERIAALQEASYSRAIERRARLGARGAGARQEREAGEMVEAATLV